MIRLCLALFTVLLSARCALTITNYTVTSYDLTFTFNATLNVSQQVTIDGEVIIEIQPTTPLTSLELYWGSSLLGFTNNAPGKDDITYSLAGNTYTAVKDVGTPANDLITITISDTNLPVGNSVKLMIKFRTKLRSDFKGLFYLQFKDTASNTRTLIASYLHPNYAREVFPCLDEITSSTKVTLRLKRPTDSWPITVASLSNDVRDNSVQGFTIDIFNDTATIPLNAFGFFLSDDGMELKTPSSPSGTTQLHFYARSNVDTKLSIDFLANLYKQIDTLTGIQHPLQTLNIILVPDLPMVFASFGNIFIRDDNYYNEYSFPQSEGRFRSLVIPVLHEFFRQFTEFSTRPLNWEDAWLSQALASFLKYTVLNNINSLFNFKTDLEVVARQSALSMDSTSSKVLQESVAVNASSATIEASLMDPLKRFKGAYLLMMADLSFPAGTVLASIKSYLSKNKQLSVASSQFFAELATIAKTVLPAISTTESTALDNFIGWSSNSGYPSLKLSNFQTTSVDLTLVFPTTVPSYYVPVTVGSKTNTLYYYYRQGIWLTGTAMYSTKLNISPNDWVIANQRSNGYYRTIYAESDWATITAGLASSDQNLIGYTQIIDDAFALAAQSLVSYNLPLTLSVNMLKNHEKLYRNWYPVYKGLSVINDYLWQLNDYYSFTDFITPFLEYLNILVDSGNLDPFESARISSLFYNQFCTFNIGNYRRDASENLLTIMSGTQVYLIPSESYDSLVCCAAQNSSLTAMSLWKYIINPSSTHDVRHYAAVAIGCLSNFTDISTLYTNMLSAEDKFFPYIMTSLWYLADQQPGSLLNSMTVTTTVNFQAKLGASAVASLLSKAASKLSSSVYAANILQLASDDSVDPVIRQAATDGFNTMHARNTWIMNNRASLVSALKNNTITDNVISGAQTTSLSLILLIPLVFLGSATLW